MLRGKKGNGPILKFYAGAGTSSAIRSYDYAGKLREFLRENLFRFTGLWHILFSKDHCQAVLGFYRRSVVPIFCSSSRA